MSERAHERTSGANMRQDAMTDEADLDTVYTRLCTTMTALGEDKATLFLARFALLAIDRMQDGPAALELIDAARDGLQD